jgi:hypothetical protein
MMEQELSYNNFLDALPPDRRSVVEAVWRVVRESVQGGYTEQITPKFLTFMAGKEWYVALANKKNYVSLHLVPLYVFPELKTKLDDSGKKFQCGKGCVTFKRAEDLPLETIAEIVGAYDAEVFQERMRQIRTKGSKTKSAKKSTS